MGKRTRWADMSEEERAAVKAKQIADVQDTVVDAVRGIMGDLAEIGDAAEVVAA